VDTGASGRPGPLRDPDRAVRANWTQKSSVIAEAIVGLIVAGVIVALLVPALGRSVGPGLAIGVAAMAVVAAVGIGRMRRRRMADRRD
jgi:protein-S-isoprenylcysteine O-methyltransferase Ste14